VQAQSACGQLTAFLADRAIDVVCFQSKDLTTNNEDTTPIDNPFPPEILPAGAITPRTDRAVISPNPPDRTPIKRMVPGIQVQGRFADDPKGYARFLLRLPDDWNGRLVVAGASGTRSEFNGDFAWSDYVVQKGYAYASQNKGTLNLSASTADDPRACRLNQVPPPIYFHEYPLEKQWTDWSDYMIAAARLAHGALRANYGHPPRHTYAVGISNGGYQVRKAIENAPELFDGGVDWEGTFVQNILSDLPPALKNYPDYAAAGFDPNSEAAQNILAAGYGPDIVLPDRSNSLYLRHFLSFWDITQALFQKRFDPTYNTYGSGTENYDLAARAEITAVAERVSHVATTGRIQRPLVSLAGTLDTLLPIRRHARAYAESVRRFQAEHVLRHADYRLYEIQNGNHLDGYKSIFPQLECIQPHAQHAFDLLVQHVEHGMPLPPDQCVPRGGSISNPPAQPGPCRELFVR